MNTNITRKKHIKGDWENADLSLGQLLVSYTTSEFSALTSDHDVPFLLFRSAVCQAMPVFSTIAGDRLAGTMLS